MEFVSVRDFRVRPSDVWKRLREEHDVILTSSGRPIAILVDVQDQDVGKSLAAIRRARAQQAVSNMRQAAAAHGSDRMSLEEIEAEIKQARLERQA